MIVGKSGLVLQPGGESVLASISIPFVVGMVVLSLTVATVVSLLYRLLMDATVPWHVPLIVGVGAVGLWMNTASTVVEFIERTAAQEPLLLQNIETNSLAIIASGIAAVGGARFGDQLATSVNAIANRQQPGTSVGKIVETIGRFITVQLPKAEKIHDLDGYEQVSEETKETFGDGRFLFPRGLTLDQLHQRIVDRLRDDYGVGHVDLELDDEGTVTYLGVGSRESGIGPTLPARRGAISIQTTPPPEATPGDRVQIWRDSEEGAQRIATAELRAAGNETATVVMDVQRIKTINQSRTYDLVTLQSGKCPELEFTSLLRTANEGLDSITVAVKSPVEGLPVGALRLPVIAIRTSTDEMHTAPPRDHICSAGDTLFVIGRPDELRKFKSAVNSEP